MPPICKKHYFFKHRNNFLSIFTSKLTIMCHKIESNFILIHELRNKQSCSINDLVNKKNIIENEIPSVFIDVSRNSILNSIYSYPEIFSWDNNRIVKNKDSNDFFEEPLISYFDIDIKDSIKNQITSILELDTF